MDTILSLKNIGYSYHSVHGEIAALSNISLDVKKGDFIAIVGPSGCGKSTLLSIIANLIKPETGSIEFPESENYVSYPKVGYMLQHDHLFEWRSIYRNVILGLEIRHQLTPNKIKKVNDMLADYDLFKFKDKRPSELSGGMRQRAALIRTLALEPEILLLDEPFSALDYQTRISVSGDICKKIRAANKTVILVTHDLAEAISLSDKVIVLSKRPGTIKKTIPIQLSVSDKSPLSARSSKEFQEYFNLLWKELEV